MQQILAPPVFFQSCNHNFFSPATKTEKKESFVRKRLVRKIFRFCHQEATFIPGKRKQCLRCDIFFLNRKKSKTLRSSAISKSVASNDCCELTRSIKLEQAGYYRTKPTPPIVFHVVLIDSSVLLLMAQAKK